MLSVGVDNYYRIRQAVINGIFEGTDIKFEVLENQNYRLEYKNI